MEAIAPTGPLAAAELRALNLMAARVGEPVSYGKMAAALTTRAADIAALIAVYVCHIRDRVPRGYEIVHAEGQGYKLLNRLAA